VLGRDLPTPACVLSGENFPVVPSRESNSGKLPCLMVHKHEIILNFFDRLSVTLRNKIYLLMKINSTFYLQTGNFLF
jgi:hypothetical protein